MRSHKTFRDELKSIGGIPGVLFSEEEIAKEKPPIWRTVDYALDQATCEYNDALPCRNPDDLFTSRAPTEDDSLFSDWLDFPEYGYVAAPFNTGRIASKESPSDVLFDELGLDVETAMDAIGGDKEGLRKRLAAATADLGTDAFACYHPWHKYVNSRRTPWGMWFHIDNLLGFADVLRLKAKDIRLPLDGRDAFDLCYLIAYRHELFHYYVEHFAIRLEILLRKPFYRPYVEDVFCNPKIVHTEDWLEEALAQAVVLNSRWIHNRLPQGISWRETKSLIKSIFREFGGGYRDFDCKKYGGPDNAHRILAAQVAQAERNPSDTSTQSFTPKEEYHISPKKVPGYLVFTPQFISRFQLGMPEYRRWKKYARSKGYRHEEGEGPGDHEVFKCDSHRIHINTKGKELDKASLKKVAKMEGRPLHAVVKEIRSF